MTAPPRIDLPWVGVDVGGTAVKLGVVRPSGERLAQTAVPLPDSPTAAEVFDRVAAAIRELAPDGFQGVGVGLPGLLDRQSGRVVESPNLPWLERARVAEHLGDALGLDPAQIRIENDANVAALGELWLGGAQGARHALIATLGTGIGGGLILNGQLFLGEGLAGEIGHVTVDPEGPACGCGSRGCLETLASASAAIRRAKAAGLPAADPGNLIELAAAARAGDGPEARLLEEIGADLGRGLATALSLLDVRTFVLGGGFSAALDVLEAGIRRGLSEWGFGTRVDEVRIARATLGADAGWIGAARLLAQ